jgi:hypothetical protein
MTEELLVMVEVEIFLVSEEGDGDDAGMHMQRVN